MLVVLFLFPGYVVALAELTFSKARWLDICYLAWALFVNLSAGSDMLAHSYYEVSIVIVPQQATEVSI